MIDFQAAREELVNQLRYEIRDERVLHAIGAVPRELFVPSSYLEFAYDDRPLSIGMGQTISQPLIVFIMTEALGLRGEEKVLEVGTGSGYQTAILAELSRRVVSTERYPLLITRAEDVLLRKLGYANIEFHITEKRLGWQEGAPYDAIIVTAGAPRVPQELLDQLATDGCLVIPVGSRYEQELLQVVKKPHTTLTRNLGSCRFVPLIGEGAWEKE